VIDYLKETAVIGTWIGVAVAVSWLLWKPRWLWDELNDRWRQR